MKLVRTFRSYWQRPARENIHLIVVIIVIFLTFIWFLRDSFNRNFKFFCMSERSLQRSDILNVMGVHVIPSVPQKRMLYTRTSKDGFAAKQGIDPYDSECLDISAADGSDSFMICIHDPFRDLMVSAHLKGEGQWEKENVQALYEAHKRFPGIALVDLGCNIGMFTLPAAKMGMEVIAVDAMLDNLKLLQRSLLVNGLDCHVTLIHNAVHRKRSKMRLVVDPTNIGGAVVKEINDMSQINFTSSQLVDAMCLDDLVLLAKGKSVFLKLDLEGTEAYVFRCAQQFFNEVTVKVVLMEWSYYRKNHKASSYIKKFLKSQNMSPTWGLNQNRVLDPYASDNWPDHVFWMKND